MEQQVFLDTAQRDRLDTLVDTHLRALRNGDVEAVVAPLTDDVEYELVGASPETLRGKEAVRAHHTREFANQMHERDVPLRRLYGVDFVVDEMIWEGRITGRVGPLVGKGRRVSQRVLRIFELRDGRVSRQSIYADFAAISRQLR